MLGIGVTDLGFLLAAGAYCGAAPFLASGIIAVNLHQHGIVDVFAESVCYRREVYLESVRAERGKNVVAQRRNTNAR